MARQAAIERRIPQIAENPAFSATEQSPPIAPASTVPPLSQSRQARMACPALYQASEIEQLREPESQPSLRGQELHAMLSAYVNHCARTNQKTDYAYLEQLLLCGATPEVQQILRAIGEDLIIDPDQVLGTEMYLALDADLQPVHTHTLGECYVTLQEHGQMTRQLICREAELPPHFEGTLDLVHMITPTEAVIDDYKSHFLIFDADTFQSLHYPLLLMQHYPHIERVEFRLRFVRYGLGAMRSVTFTRSDVPRLSRLVKDERRRQLAMHADVDAGNSLGAMPGEQCAYCPKLKSCPIREINPYASESPEEVLRFAIWAAAALRQSQQVLKAHAGATGPLSVTDGNGRQYVAQFKPIEKARYPARAAWPLLEAWEDEREPGLLDQVGISIGAKLKAKKRRALLESLAEVRQVQTMTRFGISGIDVETTEDTEGTE